MRAAGAPGADEVPLDDLVDLGPGCPDRAGGADGEDRPPDRAGRAWAGVAVCALVLVAVLLGASEVLRSPQERLEDRLGRALDAAGVELAEPVSLRDEGTDGIWTGRLTVVDDAGAVSRVRVALRPDPPAAAASSPAEALFPLVDCQTRYPLSWPGDSDNSFRTTRADLAECVTGSDGDRLLVTIAWRTQDDGAAGRQTWHADGSGGLAWLHNGLAGADGEAFDAPVGMTGDQQRAVVTAPGLLAGL